MNSWTRGRNLLLGCGATIVLLACQADGPPLPDPRGVPAEETAVSGVVPPPEIPGRSDAFENMELPPGQVARVDPVGSAHGEEGAPDRIPVVGCREVLDLDHGAVAVCVSVRLRRRGAPVHGVPR